MSLSVCGPSSIGAAIVCNQDQLPPLAPQCIAETFLRKAFSLDGCGSRGARTLSGRVTRGGAPLSTSVRLLRIGLRVDMVVSYKGKSLEPKSMPRGREPFVGGGKNFETKKPGLAGVFTAQIQNEKCVLRVVNYGSVVESCF